MTVCLTILLSDELNKQIICVVKKNKTTTAEMLRKAIALYFIAADGEERGLRFGLVNPDQDVENEIVGL